MTKKQEQLPLGPQVSTDPGVPPAGDNPPDEGNASVAQLVRMTRDLVYDGPHTADVHPDEVAGWQQHGWVVAR